MKKADNLDDLKSIVENLRKQHAKKHPNGTTYVNILFRGQANASWPLQTTLERSKHPRLPTSDYFQRAKRGLPEIESFSGQRWELEKIVDTERHRGDSHFDIPIPVYDYFIYLRHHGFPSPLLDWSESPYIAAFFAYADPVSTDNEDVAVHCYIQSSTEPSGTLDTRAGRPKISWKGPNLTTDKRHFMQKASYTVAACWDEKSDQRLYVPHEEAFRADQNRLVKVCLPSAIRTKVLRELDKYNINHFTLFHDADTLVKTMAMRAFDLNIDD